MMSIMKRMSRQIRNRLSATPALYRPLANALSTGQPVSRSTEVVIEGYPRSGNSFAEAAFRLAQGREVNIAHHCHAPAQVMLAATWSLPTVVLIRDPKEAARSLLMHHPEHFSARSALEEYIYFHDKIVPYRDFFVLVRFETVTKEFDFVIDAINRKFQTSFKKIGTSKGFDEAAFALVDEFSRQRKTSTPDGEPYSPTRSIEEKTARERLMAATRAAFETDEIAPVLARAKEIYADLESSADA